RVQRCGQCGTWLTKKYATPRSSANCPMIAPYMWQFALLLGVDHGAVRAAPWGRVFLREPREQRELPHDRPVHVPHAAGHRGVRHTKTHATLRSSANCPMIAPYMWLLAALPIVSHAAGRAAHLAHVELREPREQRELPHDRPVHVPHAAGHRGVRHMYGAIMG